MSRKKDLLTRSLTGLGIVSVTTAAIFLSPWTALIWLALLAYGGTTEYGKLWMGAKHIQQPTVADTANDRLVVYRILPTVLMMAVLFAGWTSIEQNLTGTAWFFVPVLISFVVILLMSRLKDPTAVTNTAGVVFSATSYIGIPVISGCVFLSAQPYRWEYIMLPIILIWVNDTGAYLAGTLWGKHKVAPNLSPGKSWEGIIGGWILTAIVGLILPGVWTFVNTAFVTALVIIVPGLSLAGDLWESALKRAAGVKDSGNLLPGHGGVLDRYDSLLFVLPAAALAYIIFVA
jgi:phosphatidate cytidylyltransferase